MKYKNLKITEDHTFEQNGITVTIDTDTEPRMAPITHLYTIDIPKAYTGNNTQGAGDITYSYDNSGQIRWPKNSWDDWPNESVINEMIKKYPSLKIQYDKFMTVYNLVKDDYTYEEHYEKVDVADSI